MVEITKASRARAAKALALRRQGKLLKEIGAELGVGVERARCLIDTGKRWEARSKLPRDKQ
jgi:predicted transcriptional regulator